MIARAMRENAPFRRGIALFNAGKFFEAHEAWEEIWMTETGSEKTFLQGLIQIAAAFHHQIRGNPRGMKSLLAAGLAKLSRFPATHGGIDVADLRKAAAEWADDSDRRENAGRKPPRIEPARRNTE